MLDKLRAMWEYIKNNNVSQENKQRFTDILNKYKEAVAGWTVQAGNSPHNRVMVALAKQLWTSNRPASADARDLWISKMRDQESQDIESWKKKLSDFAPASIQDDALNAKRIAQKKFQNTATKIGPNKAVSFPASNASRATEFWPRLQEDISPLDVNAWPGWETVRQNSKWQYYYINDNWNAVVTGRNPAFNYDKEFLSNF